MTRATLTAALWLIASAGSAQTPLDRADPSVVEEELRRPEKSPSEDRPPVVVAPPRIAPSGLGQEIMVGAIRIDGATVLPQSTFAPVIERYVGRRLPPAELQALAGDIAGVARRAGYGLATAGIPQQTLTNGILRVQLDEGRIDEIRAEGAAAAAVNRRLGPLADGRPVRTARLERQLQLASDLPGVRLGPARIDRRDGRNILSLRADRHRSDGYFFLDNWGTSLVGPVRAQIVGSMNDVLAADDQLSLGAVITPFQPEEFGLIRAEYSKLLGHGGTRASASAYLARARPGVEFGDVAGNSREAALALSHHFHRTRTSGLRGDIEIALREADQDFGGVRLRQDRLTTATASATLFGKVGDGFGRLRVALIQGLDAFDATERGDPLASRPDADGVFTKLELSAYYDQPLGRRFSFRAQTESQVANQALLASEEMGLGGRYFIRSEDYRERSGDRGIVSFVELRYDLKAFPGLIKSAQIYGYADVGTVDNASGGLGGGSLASAGGGVRIRLGTVDAGVELGIPVAGSSPTDRDPRLSVTLATRF